MKQVLMRGAGKAGDVHFRMLSPLERACRDAADQIAAAMDKPAGHRQPMVQAALDRLSRQILREAGLMVEQGG